MPQLDPIFGSAARVVAYGRFFVGIFGTAIATVIASCTSMLGLLMSKQRGRRWMLDIAVVWGKVLLWLSRCPLEVTFKGKLPDGGFLVFANHQSILDIPAIFIAMEKTPISFAAKRELFSIPFLGWYLSFAGFVEVDRSNRRRAMEAYAKASRQIREEGVRVTVYPEGTRSIDGSVLPFKKGAFVLAIEAQAPIVPLAIEGAQRAVPKNTFRLHGHAVRIVVGEPIPTAGLTLDDREELLIKVRRAVLALHLEAGADPSPEEPMVARPGKPSGERDA